MAHTTDRSGDPPSRYGPPGGSARSDRGPWRPGEQPARGQPRHPETRPHRVHRRVRLGQVLAGVQHDRRRVAAADQRDLHGVPAVVHAQPEPAGRGLATQPVRGDHRGPGADGRERPLDGGYGDRRLLDAADHLQPPRSTVHRPVEPVLLQRPAGHVPRLPGDGPGLDRRRRRPRRPGPVPERRRDHGSELRRRRVVLADVRRLRLLRPGQEAARFHPGGVGALPARSRGQTQDPGDVAQLRGPGRQVHPAVPEQGRRFAAGAHPARGGARGDVRALPCV